MIFFVYPHIVLPGQDVLVKIQIVRFIEIIKMASFDLSHVSDRNFVGRKNHAGDVIVPAGTTCG